MKITEESMKHQTNPQETGTAGSQPQASLPKAPLPKAPRSEKEKLRSMSGKDRAWYIWAYYKFHILAVIVAVVLVCNIGAAIYRSTFDTVLYCVYLNSRGTEGVNAAPLEQDFAAYLELDQKHSVTTESAFISFDDSATDYSYASMAKITALVASQELDVLIGDQASTDHYASLNAFMDLETSLSPELLALAEDRLYYAKGEDGTEYPCAIDLSGTGFAEESNLAQDTPLLGIIANTEHIDTAEALIRYIFEP